MNVLETENFRAVGYSDGSVWITERLKQHRPEYGPGVARVTNGHTFVVSKEEFKKLAGLLYPNTPVNTDDWWKAICYDPPYKVDYSRCAGEPE